MKALSHLRSKFSDVYYSKGLDAVKSRLHTALSGLLMTLNQVKSKMIKDMIFSFKYL